MAKRSEDTTATPDSQSINLRSPYHASIPPPYPAQTYVPSLAFMQGTWHVTHSSLPMWKKAKNVTIDYSPFASTDPSEPPTFNNLVQYQSRTAHIASTSYKKIEGVERPRLDLLGAWRWRGKRLLMIATSDWEVLGYGGEGKRGSEGEDWIVTYFAKTMFTPAGLDIYSRTKEGLDEEMVHRIIGCLKESACAEVRRLAGEMFEVERTWNEDLCSYWH